MLQVLLSHVLGPQSRNSSSLEHLGALVRPVRGEMDRAALAVHSTMLEFGPRIFCASGFAFVSRRSCFRHGFVCVGTSEPSSSAQPVPDPSSEC